MKKLKIAVLMGGMSAEHEISLSTGREVVRNLNPRKYDVLPIIVSSDGVTWQIGEKKDSNLKFKISNLKLDIVFIAMHGSYGEDGTVQGFLELLGVPYTGSGVLASALGMDKLYSRKLFIQAGLTTPDYLIIKKGEPVSKVWKKFTPPVFVHPPNQGSAIGANLVKKRSQIKAALSLAHSYSEIALVDEYLDGTEVTCAILGNDHPKALPLIEIIPKKEFFDYEAKYNPQLAEEIVPARISEVLAQKAQQAALVAYKTIGCRGFGRVDMIIKGKDVYVLEVNTIPGLTPVSLFPKAAAASGIAYPKLLDKIIELSTP